MAIYIGDNGTVKKVSAVNLGASGKKALDKGFVGVSGVRRQFWGKPEGILYFTVGDLGVMGYVYDTGIAAWTNKQEKSIGYFTDYSLSDYLTVSKVNSTTAKCEVMKHHYGYMYYNIYAVLDTGRRVRIDKLFSNLDVEMEIPCNFIFRRIAGSGSWSGTVRVIGKTVVPSGFASNTQYTSVTTDIATENAYTIYSFLYDRGNINSIAVEINIPHIKINGTTYEFRLN